jgi:putative flippase GtrA
MAISSQLMRYAIVGLASNAVLYALYLLITSLGVGHKTTMTMLYVAGVLQTFFLNRSWTFGHKGGISRSLFRYVATYGIGYLFNLAALYLLVDELGFPHQYIQGVLIIVVAVIIFILQKYWVFNNPRDGIQYYGT